MSASRMWSRVASVLVLVVAASSACSREAPARDFVARDSAGVVIAESFAPWWPAGEGWRVDPAPLEDPQRLG